MANMKKAENTEREQSDDSFLTIANGKNIAFKIGASPKNMRRLQQDSIDINELSGLLENYHEITKSMVPNYSRPAVLGLRESLEQISDVEVENEIDLLIELYDLDHKTTSEGRWVETARWIKYEEDIEGLDHHWGQPHVACLFFDTIHALKCILKKAIVISDIQVDSYANLVEQITNLLEKDDKDDVKGKVADLMHLRQIHVASRRLPRNATTSGPLGRLVHSHSTTPTFSKLHSPEFSSSNGTTRFERTGILPNNLSMPHTHHHHHVLDEGRILYSGIPLDKKTVKARSTDLAVSKSGILPVSCNYEMSESAQVFVGEVPDWKRARFIMVRFSEAVVLPEVVEALIPVRFFIFVLGPPCGVLYHEIGRSLCTMFANPKFKSLAYVANSGEQLAEGLDRFLHDSVVLPPGEIDNKRLIQGDEIKKIINKRQHMKQVKQDLARVRAATIMEEKEIQVRISPTNRLRFFNGMISDISNRLKYYKSDFTDAFTYQSITTIVFMFLASITPALTFGGLMGKYTGETMGMIETLFAQCICGVIFGLTAAQPLMIVSATGPVLIFEGSLYTICQVMGLDFLSVRFYAGAWIFVISFIVVALDGSRLLKYVTRFTEEIFAVLISAIFLAESIKFMKNTFEENPVMNYQFYLKQHEECMNKTAAMRSMEHDTPIISCHLGEPNTSLLTFMVLFSTFSIACIFKAIRQSYWFGRHFRNFFGDFGVAFAIFIVAVFVHLFFGDTVLQRLEMPEEISFTNPNRRGHGLAVVPQLADNFAGLVLALVAAMLVFILIFVETEITELLLSRKERRLIKGTGMNWDLLLMGACCLLCSVFGLPWMCAAAVQSLAHCSALTVKEKKAPGERDVPVRVIEQRITTIAISVLTGLFAFGGKYLRLPTASLFGVFLYLGVMNLIGVQLVTRTSLFLIPIKYYPNVGFVSSVTVNRIHLFTFIQILLLILVYTVKHFKESAVAFPFVLMLFILFRQTALRWIFTEKELETLDGEEEDNTEEEEPELDFYGKAPIPV